MAHDSRPFVAVIGGLWQLDEQNTNKARQIGESLGVALANAGFGLVVYFSNEQSLEPYVVSGYIKATKETQPLIKVRHPSSLRYAIKFREEDLRPELFEHVLFPGEEWEAPFYQSLANEDGIDAVLLLAGATSTLIAGQIAIARRLPILAIDALGGSAGKVWNQLAYASRDTLATWGTQTDEELVDKLKQQCIMVAADREKKKRLSDQAAQILSRRNQSVYAVASLALMLLFLALGTVFVRNAQYFIAVTFFGLVSAGAVGAASRTIMAELGTADPRTSILLGSIAGLIVGLAYLVPQWVAASGSLAPDAGLVTASDRIQFISSILVAVSAGVGFDTIFNRLKSQAEQSAIIPPKP